MALSNLPGRSPLGAPYRSPLGALGRLAVGTKLLYLQCLEYYGGYIYGVAHAAGSYPNEIYRINASTGLIEVEIDHGINYGTVCVDANYVYLMDASNAFVVLNSSDLTMKWNDYTTNAKGCATDGTYLYHSGAAANLYKRYHGSTIFTVATWTHDWSADGAQIDLTACGGGGADDLTGHRVSNFTFFNQAGSGYQAEVKNTSSYDPTGAEWPVQIDPNSSYDEDYLLTSDEVDGLNNDLQLQANSHSEPPNNFLLDVTIESRTENQIGTTALATPQGCAVSGGWLYTCTGLNHYLVKYSTALVYSAIYDYGARYPWDCCTDGTHVWTVDIYPSARIYKHLASDLSYVSHVTAENYARGITTDGTYIYTSAAGGIDVYNCSDLAYVKTFELG